MGPQKLGKIFKSALLWHGVVERQCVRGGREMKTHFWK